MVTSFFVRVTAGGEGALRPFPHLNTNTQALVWNIHKMFAHCESSAIISKHCLYRVKGRLLESEPIKA